jgi:hypothetical protein
MSQRKLLEEIDLEDVSLEDVAIDITDAKHSPRFFQPASNQKLCVVLDIDETVAKVARKEDENSPYFQYVKREHPERIIPVSMTVGGKSYLINHVLLPGVLEWIRHLVKRYHLAFFSNGESNRNNAFVDELLKCTLSVEEYEEAKNNVPIFSKEVKDLLNVKNMDKNSKLNFYKKDLNLVIESFSKKGIELSLEQIILIDDNPIVAIPEHERNLLVVPGFFSFHNSGDDDFLCEPNQIFFAAEVLDMLSREKKPIDFLNALQVEDFDRETFKKYCECGLKRLQRINPELELITPKNIAVSCCQSYCAVM